MSIIDSIEKLITEHGSAAILGQQLAFAKDQFAQLERKVSDLQTQAGHLEAQLEREQLDHKMAREESQRLHEEYAEEIRIHSAIEFRRGKRTGGVWIPFCPQCRMPATFDDDARVACSLGYPWSCNVSKPELGAIISSL